MRDVPRELLKVLWREDGLEEDPDYDGWTILDNTLLVDTTIITTLPTHIRINKIWFICQAQISIVPLIELSRKHCLRTR